LEFVLLEYKQVNQKKTTNRIFISVEISANQLL